jgi:hypothetical protein
MDAPKQTSAISESAGAKLDAKCPRAKQRIELAHYAGEQGRAGKIQDPVRNSKIGPYFTRKFEKFNKYNGYILISDATFGNIKNHANSTSSCIMFI